MKGKILTGTLFPFFIFIGPESANKLYACISICLCIDRDMEILLNKIHIIVLLLKIVNRNLEENKLEIRGKGQSVAEKSEVLVPYLW